MVYALVYTTPITYLTPHPQGQVSFKLLLFFPGSVSSRALWLPAGGCAMHRATGVGQWRPQERFLDLGQQLAELEWMRHGRQSERHGLL
jgi:hypothetical protein